MSDTKRITKDEVLQVVMYVPITTMVKVRGPANIVFSREDMMKYSAKELVGIMRGEIPADMKKVA